MTIDLSIFPFISFDLYILKLYYLVHTNLELLYFPGELSLLSL